jgi:hypothetical protein
VRAQVVNGRTSLKALAVGPGNLEIAVWGRHLTNGKSSDFLTALPSVYATSFQRARTFGVDLIEY